MKKNHPQPLHGTSKEMANQLFAILKDSSRSLSKEKLKEIIPLSENFISAFVDVLKEEIASDKQGNEDFRKTISNISDALLVLIKDGELSESEKIKALDIISDCGKHLYNYEVLRKKKDSNIIQTILVCVTALVGIVITFASGGRVKPPQKKA
ncbi:MAG: hypothetical protein MJZ07_02010 [Bacteroidales bacterium]|nr:hypothetical protein [Bacteroidales bacterium]